MTLRDHKQTVRNALAAVGQAVLSGVLLFLLYRFLLEHLGAAQLGVWALVLASTNISRLGGMGLNGGAVRFVARYLARNERDTAAQVVETATLAIAGAIGVALVPAGLLLTGLLPHLVPAEGLAAALGMLPYALASVWLNAIAVIVQSSVDGCQRSDLRSVSGVIASVVYFCAALAMVPSLGLHGLALAQVLQSVLSVVLNWRTLRRVLPEVRWMPLRFRRPLFVEMARYGVNFQAESIFAMLHDPIAKSLLAKYGGLPAVGYYEMASRLVFQLRALIGSAFGVLVPVIATHQENAPERVRKLYATSCRTLTFVSVPAYGAIIAAAPLISLLWIGWPEPIFILCVVLLSLGWLVNALNAPALHANLGTGELAWNTIASIAIAVLNLVLGVLLGMLFGGPGVVASWALALAGGSMLVGTAYHRRHRIPWSDWLNRESRAIFLSAALGAIVAHALYGRFFADGHALSGAWAAVGLYALIVCVPMWMHPVRERLLAALLEQTQATSRG